MPIFTDGYSWPVGSGYHVALAYGAYYLLQGKYPAIHPGIDLSIEPGGGLGLPIYAQANGVVTFARDITNQTWRKLVVIRHDDPDGTVRCSRYGHLLDINVSLGQQVFRRQIIGHEGNADGVFYPHLHTDLARGDLLIRHPDNWPGNDSLFVVQNYYDPSDVFRRNAPLGNEIDQVKDLLNQSIRLLNEYQPPPAPAPPPVPRAGTVNAPAGTLNVRSVQSTTNNTPVASLANGVVISVIDAPDPSWLKIVDGQYAGNYVWKDFVSF